MRHSRACACVIYESKDERLGGHRSSSCKHAGADAGLDARAGRARTFSDIAAAGASCWLCRRTHITTCDR